jgi:hypothetical protein
VNDVTPLERAAAIFLTRTMLGFVYLFAGMHKLLDPGAWSSDASGRCHRHSSSSQARSSWRLER